MIKTIIPSPGAGLAQLKILYLFVSTKPAHPIMKHLLTIAFAALVSFNALAQANLHRCSTFEIMQKREQLQSGYLAGTKAAFDAAKQLVEANRVNRVG
jgi:uncharacterized membrane protein YidH (DUF202 family)